ncbi:Immunogenic protein MPT70 precursor [Pigmentiphaga humi]|uniref:Immunogenic protein MPT70 n=1 Tax=Pigmentiphaga humi TaxID=2478468 RepID=A0A3P4AY28_9BURK|nr:fasciclin domain-containing protein [Pigmentiphaga humi]VCU68320.1 Immunogenic protein MPT70 precursor [Pigmentiphaga humi]
MFFRTGVRIAAVCLALGSMQPYAMAASNIVDTAATAGMFSSWIQGVRDAGLEPALKGPGPYTVFIPSDEAFAKLPAERRDALRNKETLAHVLKLHMAPGKLRLKDAKEGTRIKTQAGETLTVHREKNTIKLGEGEVLEPDVEVGNGVINVVDTVFFP